MKFNLQKIIALIAVLAVTVSILNISVSALLEADYFYVVGREIYDDITELMESHRNGDITVSEVLEGLATIEANAIASGFNYEANKINRLINGLQRSNGGAEHGGGGSGGSRSPISDIWDDICNKHNVPTETTQTSTTDMRGFGARLDLYSDGKLFTSKYGDYIVIQRFLLSNGTYSYTITLYPQRASQVYPNNKGWSVGYFESYVSNTGAGDLSESDLSKFKWYGDVRYVGFGEGEEPPTNDEFTYGTIHKFDDMNDKQISDLINEFSEELERQNPDLSSLEGLLNAIYARLGTLDSDDDNGLLSQINISIQSLNASISGLSTSIETSINDLKETITSLLTNEDKKDDDNKTDTETEKHEISGTLYNVIPLEKNWIQKIISDKSNLKVEYQGTVYYLEDDGTLKLDGKYYKVDMNYSSTLDEILYTLYDIRDSLELLSEEEKKMSFNDFFDLKLSDLKSDFDEKFKFKDNIKDFLQRFYDVFENALPQYESGA